MEMLLGLSTSLAIAVDNNHLKVGFVAWFDHAVSCIMLTVILHLSVALFLNSQYIFAICNVCMSVVAYFETDLVPVLCHLWSCEWTIRWTNENYMIIVYCKASFTSPPVDSI